MPLPIPYPCLYCTCTYISAVSVTIEKLSEIAPQPVPQKFRDGAWPQDKDWPSLKGGHGDHTPIKNQQAFQDPAPGDAHNSQDWNQNTRQEWNRVVKRGDQAGGHQTGRKGSGFKETGGGYAASGEGPNIQAPFVSPGLGGANTTLFSPPHINEMDGRARYPPPLNPGSLRHGQTEMSGTRMQTRPFFNSGSNHPEMFSTGMGFGPRMPSRPPHPEVPGMGMGTKPVVHSRSNPHDMAYSQPQPAFMRWMGYGGVQDPNFTLNGPPVGPGRDDRPRPFLQGMPRPPMQGGYGVPMMANNYHGGMVDGRMGEGRHLDVAGPERMHGLIPYPSPDVSRSHSADGGVGGGRRGTGFGGHLVLLRGLPGSGKTTLAK